VERAIAELKALPDVVLAVLPPEDLRHLGPREGLDEHTKELLLANLDGSGVDPADQEVGTVFGYLMDCAALIRSSVEWRSL
jgi:hypothetical protein